MRDGEREGERIRACCVFFCSHHLLWIEYMKRNEPTSNEKREKIRNKNWNCKNLTKKLTLFLKCKPMLNYLSIHLACYCWRVSLSFAHLRTIGGILCVLNVWRTSDRNENIENNTKSLNNELSVFFKSNWIPKWIDVHLLCSTLDYCVRVFLFKFVTAFCHLHSACYAHLLFNIHHHHHHHYFFLSCASMATQPHIE